MKAILKGFVVITGCLCIAVAVISFSVFTANVIQGKQAHRNEYKDSTQLYKRLYLECNTKLKHDSTHKDCFRTK